MKRQTPRTPAQSKTPTFRDLRQRACLSMRELSALSGVCLLTIFNTENGVTSPTPATCRRLASALRLDPAIVRAAAERSSLGDLECSARKAVRK